MKDSEDSHTLESIYFPPTAPTSPFATHPHTPRRPHSPLTLSHLNLTKLASIETESSSNDYTDSSTSMPSTPTSSPKITATSHLNPFFGYPVISSTDPQSKRAALLPILLHSRRRKRDLVKTLFRLWIKRLNKNLSAWVWVLIVCSLARVVESVRGIGRGFKVAEMTPAFVVATSGPVSLLGMGSSFSTVPGLLTNSLA